jgi:myosin protein heavy chain
LYTADESQRLESQLQDERLKYEDLEDAVLTVEAEKADWAKRMEATSRQLVEESARRQHFEQQLYDSQVELAEHRNTALQAEREVLKYQGDIKARDEEIALLRSRENKTVIEHVHVLEKAKKFAEMQLANQVSENQRLNSLLKQIEATKNRLQHDLEDVQRQMEVLKASRGREARAARASMSGEEKDAVMQLQDERRARQAAEARVVALERDLAEQRRQQSAESLSSPSRANLIAESRLQKKNDELDRLQRAHEAVLAQNQKLQSDFAELQQSVSPSTPIKNMSSNRADLLRGLQQSHEALGRDMSDQLRKLETQPLTPSRRHNSSLSNGHGTTNSPDLAAAKRIRTLEMEINGLRQQLEDEREEKEFLWERAKELEEGTDGRPPLNCERVRVMLMQRLTRTVEQGMYSHFRLKAKSLRSQLDQ